MQSAIEDFGGLAESHFFTSRRLRLHYLLWDRPGAPTLLLIHGGRDHCRSMTWIAHHFADRFRIIAPDLAGHGDSEWARDGAYSVDYFTYDIRQLFEASGSSQVSIIGHSFGGSVALRFAASYPEHVLRVAALEGLGLPWIGTDEVPVSRHIRNWHDRIDTVYKTVAPPPRSLEASLQRMLRINKQLPMTHQDYLVRNAVREHPDGGYCWKRDADFRARPLLDLQTPLKAAVWSDIQCPVLLLSGERSHAWGVDPARDGLLKFFKSASTRRIPNAGHWLHHDNLPDTLCALQEFLE